jgi:hypothetical protein
MLAIAALTKVDIGSLQGRTFETGSHNGIPWAPSRSSPPLNLFARRLRTVADDHVIAVPERA